MNWRLFGRFFVDAVSSIKLTLLGLLILIVALLGMYLSFEKPSYKTSWIILLPGTERASTISLDNLGEARSNGANAYGSVSISPKNTYKEIALSDAVINSAAKQYGVEAYAFSKPRITLIDQTPAMKFTLKGESSEELVHRATLYNQTFHAILDELRNNEIERNYQGIESNLEEAKQRLSQARQDIVAYQIESSILSDDQFKRWVSDTEQLRTEQTNTDVELSSMTATIESSLKQLGLTAEQAQALLTLQANPTVATSLNLLSEKLAELARMRSSYASEHPIRKILELEISSLKDHVRTLIKGLPQLQRLGDTHLYGVLSSSNAQNIRTVNELLAKRNGLLAQRNALENSREVYLDRINGLTQGAATLADLQRAHQIAEAIFSSALAKLDTSRLDIYATYPLTQLLTQPGATVKRDRLQAKLMIVASGLIYALLALALTLTRMRKNIMGVAQPADAHKAQSMQACLSLQPQLKFT